MVVKVLDAKYGRLKLDPEGNSSILITRLGIRKRKFYSSQSKGTAFSALWDLHPSVYGKVKIYGREINTPRWQHAYLNDYNFSGMNHVADPLPEEFKPFLDAVNNRFGKFDQVLINWYEHGNHYIGPHSDDTRQLKPNSPIITISLGGEGRIFRIREKGNKSTRIDVVLHHGDTIVMEGEMQKYFTHEIVKTTGKQQPGPRISITFRQFKN